MALVIEGTLIFYAPYYMNNRTFKPFMQDKQLQNLVKQELKRQHLSLDLIASENYASPQILKILGSPLVNKYSEGYPGRRYYPGNKFYDLIEKLAQDRARQVFNLSFQDWDVNVQPYSGSPANLAIYFALMNPGDVLMGMNLMSGGHLTHGHKVNFSGKIYRSVQYGVNKQTGLIDYAEAAKLAKKYKPKIIVSGLTAYPRKINFKKFGQIAKSAGAYHLADISHIAGLVAADLHQSPFRYSDIVMTTTHKTLRGPRGAIIFTRKKLSEKIDRAVFPGMQGGPHNNVVAAKAVMFFEALKPGFKQYQRQVVKNAAVLADNLKNLGFRLVTNGTDNHIILVDLKNFLLDGLAAEKILEKNNITANRNAIPGDQSPFKPSGIRIGTPAVTTRGMCEREMSEIAEFIYLVLIKKRDVKKEVEKLCRRFPLEYGY